MGLAGAAFTKAENTPERIVAPATWVVEFVDADNRATTCACLRQYVFRRAVRREIRLSGSTRGEWDAPQGVALSPTLPTACIHFAIHAVGHADHPVRD